MTTNVPAAAAGGLAAAVFAAIAALHGYWALGGVWPGDDPESLARTVVGGPPGMRMPGAAACWAVAVALVGAVAVALGAAGILAMPLPRWLVRGAALLGAGVLVLRGLVGFADLRLRPDTAGSPFVRLNRWIYSPLCLALAALLGAAAR
jgi:hypothetical protein